MPITKVGGAIWKVDDCFIHAYVFYCWMYLSDMPVISFRMCLSSLSFFLFISTIVFGLFVVDFDLSLPSEMIVELPVGH